MNASRWRGRNDDALVDLIYDAALDEALWPAVLAQVGDRAGAHPGNLIEINFLNGAGFGLATRAPDDIISRYFADWAVRNPIALAENPDDYRTGWAPRITRDSQSVDRSRLERSDFWNDFLVPIDAHHLSILRLSLRGDSVTTITLGRPDRRGPFEDAELAALAPWHRHLVRAERIWRSLGLRQVQLDQLDMLLARSSDALFFLDDGFRVVRRTAAAEALLSAGATLCLNSGRLHANRMADDATLHRALTTALIGGTPAPVTLAGALPADALSVSIARLSDRAMAGVGGARCLLVSARRLPGPTPVDALRGYRLTTAETELALALAAGDSLRAVAERRGVSINTVRNQLSAVFDKTGCRRQQDLVRLLAAPPR